MLWLCAVPPTIRAPAFCLSNGKGPSMTPAPWVYARPPSGAGTPKFLRRGQGPGIGTGSPGFRSFAPMEAGNQESAAGKIHSRFPTPDSRPTLPQSPGDPLR